MQIRAYSHARTAARVRLCAIGYYTKLNVLNAVHVEVLAFVRLAHCNIPCKYTFNIRILPRIVNRKKYNLCHTHRHKHPPTSARCVNSRKSFPEV